MGLWIDRLSCKEMSNPSKGVQFWFYSGGKKKASGHRRTDAQGSLYAILLGQQMFFRGRLRPRLEVMILVEDARGLGPFVLTPPTLSPRIVSNYGSTKV